MEIKIDKNIKNQKKKNGSKKKFKDVQNYRLRNPNVYVSQTHNQKKKNQNRHRQLRHTKKNPKMNQMKI